MILQLSKVYENVVPFLWIKLWERNIIKIQEEVVELLDLQERKWNVVKNRKMQYFKFLNNLCSLSIDSEYSLHHKFSPARNAEN